MTALAGSTRYGKDDFIASTVAGKSPVKATHPAPVIPEIDGSTRDSTATQTSCQAGAKLQDEQQSLQAQSTSHLSHMLNISVIQLKHMACWQDQASFPMYTKREVQQLTNRQGNSSGPICDGRDCIHGHFVVETFAVNFKDMGGHRPLAHTLQSKFLGLKGSGSGSAGKLAYTQSRSVILIAIRQLTSR